MVSEPWGPSKQMVSTRWLGFGESLWTVSKRRVQTRAQSKWLTVYEHFVHAKWTIYSECFENYYNTEFCQYSGKYNKLNTCMYCYKPKYNIWLNNRWILNERWAQSERFVNGRWANGDECFVNIEHERSRELKWTHCGLTVSAPWTHRKMRK